MDGCWIKVVVMLYTEQVVEASEVEKKLDASPGWSTRMRKKNVWNRDASKAARGKQGKKNAHVGAASQSASRCRETGERRGRHHATRATTPGRRDPADTDGPLCGLCLVALVNENLFIRGFGPIQGTRLAY
jgi:hypothetical protein